MVALGDLLKATYPGTSYSISRTCGTDPLPTSEHYDGRAVDWFTSVRTATGKARADALIRWLLATDAMGNAFANARRLGIMYVIWNGKIWGAYRASDGWRPYQSCAQHPEKAYDTTCHRDHMHFSLSWEGAMKRTSWWTKQVAAVDYGPCRAADLNWADPYTTARATPCPSYPRVTAEKGSSALHTKVVTYSGSLITPGATGPVVTIVQQAIGMSGADGIYGSQTKAAVLAYKTEHRLAVNGIVGDGMWRAMLADTAPKPGTTTPSTATTNPPSTTNPTPAPSNPTTAAQKQTLLQQFWTRRTRDHVVDVNLLIAAEKNGRHVARKVTAIRTAMARLLKLRHTNRTRIAVVQKTWRSTGVVDLDDLRPAAANRPRQVRPAYRAILRAANAVAKR
ncbi:peptidoglycan-binding protein [Nocardioides sp. DS6]|uniref:Peptidoglycan-binding protein n=1 Tax=Nocardioides eburneus TaxID=3231482 RepID=A0ABV3SWM1_9ACTN